MTQEDKKLLLIVLSAMLPYATKVFYEYVDELNKKTYGYSLTLNTWCINELVAEKAIVKPYLRPMSSMTEEEKEELKNLFDAEEVTSDFICYLEGGTLEEYLSHISYSFCSEIIDWLNAHHFDYRGLIERGLAIAVTEENNPYKE